MKIDAGVCPARARPLHRFGILSRMLHLQLLRALRWRRYLRRLRPQPVELRAHVLGSGRAARQWRQCLFYGLSALLVAAYCFSRFGRKG